MFRNQSLAFLKSAMSIVLISAGFCCWVLLCVVAFKYVKTAATDLHSAPHSTAVVVASTEGSVPKALTKAQNIESTTPVKVSNELRYTTMGWQTPSHWMRQPTQVSRLSMDRLHPVLLGLGILFTSLMAIVMDAPDEEIERLVESSKLGRKEAVALKLNKLRTLNRD